VAGAPDQPVPDHADPGGEAIPDEAPDHADPGGEAIPDEARCAALLDAGGLSDGRIAHSRAVAEVAVAIAQALNEHGSRLCIPLVRAGGLLHDVARGQERHADAGADLLERSGYPRVAAVVRLHMDLGGPGGDTVDEARVVFLADKLVKGDRVVGLERRFAVRFARWAGDPAMLATTYRRKAQAEDVLARVEELIGRPVTEVLPAGLVDPPETE
jgi:molybdenum cofactor cytidylyltransferase